MSAFLSADWILIGRQVANHLWQSTLFAAVAGLLALSLRNNHARLGGNIGETSGQTERFPRWKR